MNVAMFTNLYLPRVGGVSLSVERFARRLRERDHRVLVVCPSFPNQPDREPWVARVPAIQQFNGSDFSVPLPLSFDLSEALDAFEPDLIHAHHPFLLGDAALRAAAHRALPLVYTHHTMYEFVTHYVPGDSRAMKEYLVRLVARYADLCERVIAPSESIREVLMGRGVEVPVDVAPTGVEVAAFEHGDPAASRRKLGIPPDAFVMGYVGRMTPEKSIGLLARAAMEAMKRLPEARLLLIGSGSEQRSVRRLFEDAGQAHRAVIAGTLSGQELVDAYHAMDVFLFASKTETQGMVLAEAMAAGRPVVALDAPGAREIVRDGVNGRLVKEESAEALAQGALWTANRDADGLSALRREARRTASDYDESACAQRLLAIYRATLREAKRFRDPEFKEWKGLLAAVRMEWEIWSNRIASATEAVLNPKHPENASDRPPASPPEPEQKEQD